MTTDTVLRCYLTVSAVLTSGWSGLIGRIGSDRERGDVPGWVMITVMTAALVVAILVPFRSAITSAVSNALNQVTGAAGS